MGFTQRFLMVFVSGLEYFVDNAARINDFYGILFFDSLLNLILFAIILAQVMENRMEIQAWKHPSNSVNGMWGTCSICGESYTATEIPLHRKGRCGPTTQQKNSQLFDKPESER